LAGHDTPESISGALDLNLRGTRVLCNFLAVGGLLELRPDAGYQVLCHPVANRKDRLHPVARLIVASTQLGRPPIDLHERFMRGATNAASWRRTKDEYLYQTHEAVRTVVGHLRSRIPTAPKILDLGCGPGGFSAELASLEGAKVVGLDYPEVVKVARDIVEVEWPWLAGSQELTFRGGDIPSMEFGEGYDLILAANFLHCLYLPNIERVAGKIARALAPGGLFAIFDAFHDAGGEEAHSAACMQDLLLLISHVEGRVYSLTEMTEALSNSGLLIEQMIQIEGRQLILARPNSLQAREVKP